MGKDAKSRTNDAKSRTDEKRDEKRNSVIEANNLSRRFGDVAAVQGLSIAVPPGELYGLVGPDGAGKTTTLRMLTGLMTPNGGSAHVMGQAVLGRHAMREAIGYMPQQYSLYGDLSVHENLRFFGRLFGLKRRDFQTREARLLHITRLERFSDRRADKLSGGMYKKLALACALLHRPKILVLDEPTNGVDPISRRELWDLLYEFVEGGMAILLATPYMDEAARCHRVGVIHHGRLLAEDSPKALSEAFIHRTFLIGSANTRRRLETALEARSEVLGLTPHGGAFRVVVNGKAGASFARWAAKARDVASLTAVQPNFEDVFIGLLPRVSEGWGTVDAGSGSEISS
ncbi:MAG: ABC transporter ATP-binding protein [Deltaproteobacteria bacterium]|nr:ABC transporter ATP-binding protein [Deltaproteobacteria bacterium]